MVRIEKEKASEQVIGCFGSLIDWENPLSSYLLKNSYFRGALNSFFDQRPEKKKFPVHFLLYNYLDKNNYDWGNLLNEDITTYPLFYMDEKQRLHELDMIIIGFCFSQSYVEGKIDKILRDFTINAINREIHMSEHEMIDQIHNYKRQENLIDLRNRLRCIKVLGIVNTNLDVVDKFFINQDESDD